MLRRYAGRAAQSTGPAGVLRLRLILPREGVGARHPHARSPDDGDRERILWALDDVRTDVLAELRGVLLQEHEWRSREGLV